LAISGLLMALPLLSNNSELRLTTALESSTYVDMTLSIQEQFGVFVQRTGEGWSIPGGQVYRSPGELAIGGDWSNGALWLCRGVLAGEIEVMNLSLSSHQGDKLIVRRQFEDRYHILEVKMPCLLTTLSEMNKPRYMSVAGVFDAYREKDVKVMTLEDIKDHIDVANIGLKGSPTRVKKSFTKTAKGAGTKYEVEPEEAVKVIMDTLAQKCII